MKNKIIGYQIDGEIQDLHRVNENDKNSGTPIYLFSEEGENIARHSAAHILGEVLLEKYKNIYFAIGPTTEYGFYYDVLMNENISVLQLEEIENQMKEIVKKKSNFSREIITISEANRIFKNDICKQIILEQLEDEKVISVYKQGDFIDLCKGPHVKNTEDVGNAFKLTRVSQVQWKDKLLQRVEGKLFYSKERLTKHLELIKKQESIDHRKLGEEMELFKQLPISQGNMFWLKKGASIFHLIVNYLSAKYDKYNYNVVKTPLIFHNQLWKDTGHWDKYMENMYITQNDMVVKPMNCPGHVETFKIYNNSYKDLPYRIGEICHVHRKEESGSLNGLKRATGFHQDDGHIFCKLDQIEKEIMNFYDMLQEIYGDFGFNKYRMILSTRPEQYIGTKETWNQSENILKNWLEKNKISYVLKEGDGAFYGPKLEVQLEDNFLRYWTCGTFQLDFFLPERLQASYMTEHNTREFPIMCHRAILGSLERFIAILLENYEGHLPLWIQPTTVVVISISEKTAHYATKIFNQLKKKKIRADLDISNNTLGSKLKRNLILKTPFILIVGEEELKNNNITVREKNQNTRMTIREFIDEKLKEVYTPISRR